MSAEKVKKRKGCLTAFLILILVIALIIVGLWMLVFHKGPSKAAKDIINGPVDPAASEVVKKALVAKGIVGVQAVVVPLKGDKGNAAIIVIDPQSGFKPATGPDGKRKQAMDSIKQLVEVNKNSKLGLQRVGLEYQEKGKSIIALTAPMNALDGLSSGKLNDAQFLADVDVRFKDILFLKNLINNGK